MKKVTILILTIFLSLSYFGCQKNTWQKKLTIADVNIWDSLTVAFINNNCQLEGKDLIPSGEVETLDKMMELFKNDLQERNNIVETFRKYNFFYNQDSIYVIESFHHKLYDFEVTYLDSIYSFKLSEGKYTIDKYLYSINEEIYVLNNMDNCDTRSIVALGL